MSPQDSSDPLGRVGCGNSLSLQERRGDSELWTVAGVGLRSGRESPGEGHLLGHGGRK